MEKTPNNTITGAELIAKALKKQEVEVVFGIVGIPVVEVITYILGIQNTSLMITNGAS